MPFAYVLVDCEVGAEDPVLNDLKKLKNVVEAHKSFGLYDIIVKVEADHMGVLKEIVFQNIRGLKKVRSTLTLIIRTGFKV